MWGWQRALPKDPARDPHAPRSGDSPAVAAWRERMGTAAAKEIYKERAATAEWVNAQARHRGFWRLLVRGLEKVRAIALRPRPPGEHTSPTSRRPGRWSRWRRPPRRAGERTRTELGQNTEGRPVDRPSSACENW